MKRFKTSSIAILALVTGALASAFVPSHSHPAKPSVKSDLISYWWFDVQSITGSVITPESYPDPVIGGYAVTRAVATSSNAPDCGDGTSPACIGGYMLSQVNFDQDGYAVSIKMNGNAYAQPVLTILHSVP